MSKTSLGWTSTKNNYIMIFIILCHHAKSFIQLFLILFILYPPTSTHFTIIRLRKHPSLNWSHFQTSKATDDLRRIFFLLKTSQWLMITLKYFRSTTAAYSSQIIQTSTNTLERHAKKFLWTSRTHYVLKRGFQFLPDRSAAHPVYWPSFFRQTIHVQRTASITCKLSALAVKREETVSVRGEERMKERKLNSSCALQYRRDFSLPYRGNRRTEDASGDGPALRCTHTLPRTETLIGHTWHTQTHSHTQTNMLYSAGQHLQEWVCTCGIFVMQTKL